MLRAPRFTRQLLRSQSTAATSAASTLPVPAFSEVKFQKEDVDKVMAELPPYNFYEIKEPVPNPYRGYTLDTSVLIDPPSPALAEPSMQFSKLENGLKIGSVDRQGLTAQLGLFVDAGSRHESSANFGVSHMVSLMAFKSTAHLSHLRTVKTLEQLGANATSTCTAGRENIAYQVAVMREFVPLVVPLMIGNVLFPRLLPWEVKPAHGQVKEARAQMMGNPNDMLNELLHKAAYCNNTLGLSPTASDRSLSHFTPDTVRSYMLDHFAPERMAIVGVNVAHEELAKWAMRSFAEYNAIPMKPRQDTAATYTGGDVRVEGASPYCHLAIALESVAVGQAIAPVTLLQTILGGGSAVVGGPGAGATSRLSTQVLKQSPYVESCAAFNTSYSDSGLFGVVGVSHAGKATEMSASMLQALAGLTEISADELDTAKAVLKGKLFRQMEDPSVLMKDLGEQLLHTGNCASASDLARMIDGVSVMECTTAAKKLLSSKPTVASFGDTHTVPHYSQFTSALGSA